MTTSRAQCRDSEKHSSSKIFLPSFSSPDKNCLTTKYFSQIWKSCFLLSLTFFSYPILLFFLFLSFFLSLKICYVLYFWHIQPSPLSLSLSLSLSLIGLRPSLVNYDHMVVIQCCVSLFCPSGKRMSKQTKTLWKRAKRT